MGLVARGLEEAGLSTVYLGSCRDMMAQVNAPRNVFLDFPLGRQCGKPNDIKLQTEILKAALGVLASAPAPGTMVDLPYQWHESFTFESYGQDQKDMLEEEGQPLQDWKPKNKIEL